MIGIIRDPHGQGVRADRIEAWTPYGPKDEATVVLLMSGESCYLWIPFAEFVQRLDSALTALAGSDD